MARNYEQLSMSLYLIGICYLVLLCECYVALRSFLYATKERRQKRGSYYPRVAVIAPHYGWDQETEKNVLQLLGQDYQGHYQLYFVTHATGAKQADVSHSHLKRLTASIENADVVIAPNIVDEQISCSQKIQNLITVINQLPVETEIIAFVDADAFVHETWLTSLVEPLQDEKIGATVGARLYLPQIASLAAYTEAAWVNFQIPLQANPAATMVLGGSNAIRRELIESGKIIQRWSNATIEDHNLTHAVKDQEQKIHFVPDCITVNRLEMRTWGQVLEFTTRQMIMTFWMGHRKAWLATFIGSVPKNVILLFALLSIFWFDPVPLSLVFLVPFFEIQCYRISLRILPEWLRSQSEIQKNIHRSSIFVPLSSIVAAFNVIITLFKKEIVWGGVRYKILSATTSQIMGRVKNNE